MTSCPALRWWFAAANPKRDGALAAIERDVRAEALTPVRIAFQSAEVIEPLAQGTFAATD